MTLLVTGGAGYIGSHTVHQLLEAGHNVAVIDNLSSGHRWAVPSAARFYFGDAGDTLLLSRIFSEQKIDAVLHFAAFVDVGESVRNPAKYYRGNTVTTLNLFETSLRHGVDRILFSSTAAVYGQPSTSLVDERQTPQPINPYGASKWMSERMLHDFGKAHPNLRSVILRYFNVAGARRDLLLGQASSQSTHLLKIATQTALGQRPHMVIHGTDYPTTDGTCERDFLHVDDLAQAHLDALNYMTNGGPSETFNVGYGRLCSVRQVIDTIKKVARQDFKVVEGPRREGDPASLGADSQKIRSVLGWKPRFDDLTSICETAFAWEKELLRRQSEIGPDTDILHA